MLKTDRNLLAKHRPVFSILRLLEVLPTFFVSSLKKMKKLSTRPLLLFAVVCFLGQLPTTAKAQHTKDRNFPEYKEEPDDPYIPVAKDQQPTSPGYHFVGPNIFTVQVNVNAEGENILGDAANEPSIAIDPLNPDYMVIGWRQFDTIASNFRQAGFAYTTDGGQTWTYPGVIEPGVFRSDPVLDFDNLGTIFYNSLTVEESNDYRCDVYQSTGTGTWDAGVFAYGGDKQWMVIDRTGGQGEGHIYANWKAGLSSCTPGSFTRSTDGGATFEGCVGTMGEPVRGTLAVGPAGELYAFGQSGNGFVIARSSTASDPMQPVTWDFAQTVPLGGPLGLYDGPNPTGMLGQGWVAVDQSGGVNNGHVYALASVERDDINDPLDVMFAKSINGGQTWSAPIRINDDLAGEAWQWFGTIAVAPNGRIDVVWLDTRLDFNGYGSALFYSNSLDGGASWSPNAQLSDVFDPHLGWPNQQKMGDYMHLISENEGAHLAWTGTFNGEQDVFYSYITPEVVSSTNQTAKSTANLQAYPNPFTSEVSIAYQLQAESFVQINVYDAEGQLVSTLARAKQPAGKHLVHWDAHGTGNQVSNGLYICELLVDGQIAGVKRLVKVDQ